MAKHETSELDTLKPLSELPPGAAAAVLALPLYLQIALRYAHIIASGTLQAGQRLPSVRDAAAQSNVSVSTVVQALATLEEHRLVQPRAKSGYFVATASRAKAAALVRKIRQQPEPPKPAALAAVDSHSALQASTQLIAQASQSPVSFAGYSPKDKDFFDADRLRVALSREKRRPEIPITRGRKAPGPR